MDKIIFIIHKKLLKDKQRSLDLALSYLKDNLELKNNRWITRENTAIRIG